MADERSVTVVRTVSALRARIAVWREGGERVALVPTMGALHEGHASLIRLAGRQADRVVASVFVNPRQFAPTEDFDAYPRDEAADARLLTAEHCDLMYAPSPEEMYPPGFVTAINVKGAAEPLDGAARPGHFDGVATVVAKLLLQARPDMAVFGEKDFQQLLVIRRLARDLDLSVDIIGAPIARAEDGLALSSRNAYLSAAERVVAGRLNLILYEAAAALRAGASVERVETESRTALERAGFGWVDYLEVRGAEELVRMGPEAVDGPARLFAAAWLGRTRLIDNVPV